MVKMTKKRFTVHIEYYNYEKTEGEITLEENGQPLLVSDCIDDVQMVKNRLNELYYSYNSESKKRDKILDILSDLEDLDEWKRKDLLNALDKIAVIVGWQTEQLGVL